MVSVLFYLLFYHKLKVEYLVYIYLYWRQSKILVHNFIEENNLMIYIYFLNVWQLEYLELVNIVNCNS